MKNISRIILLAVLPVLSGCLPQKQLTGRVLDLTGPVPNAAVLGMIWIEDVDKAKPALSTDGLNSEDRNAAYEKDATERGLPVAYARAFTDEKGWYTLDKLYFSGETKKAVKAMKQPKITRITLCAFQRGYLKGALTAFPKEEKELPYATMVLLRPANWKELSLDSSFSSLERPEYYNGYSKEFGATKEEKNWFLEYTHSNLYKAYVDSDIKGHKEWESYCGHDYSDIIVSTAGMQRNPAHERCGELLKRIGDVRANEEFWENHALKPGDWVETVKGLVKEAIAGMGAETGEPKEYEREILEGINAGNKTLKETVMINWVEDSEARLEEAKILYGKGDKAAAYRLLGQAIHARMRTVPVTATITMIIPAIKDAVAGFYLLMNRPLTAQLPGSDKPVETIEAKQQEPSTSTSPSTIIVSTTPGTFSQEEAAPAEEYTYEAQSENKEVTAKMINDELEQTGVQVHFFDNTGKLLGKWEIKDTSAQAWALSPRGNYFMCEIFRRVIANDPWTREVVVMDNTGKELFSYQSSGGIGRWSPTEDYIIVHDHGFTAVRAYDLKGKVIWEKKKPENVKQLSLAKISKNGKYIALGEYPKTMVLLTKDGRELYRKDFEIIPGKLKFNSIFTRDIDNEGNIILTPGDGHKIFIIDKNGKIKLEKLIEDFDPYHVLFSTYNFNEIIITERHEDKLKRIIQARPKLKLKWR